MKIYKRVETAEQWFDYFSKNLWIGAKDRWNAMNSEEKWYLCGFASGWFSDEMELSETDINDFIWFDWDDMREELRNQEQEQE